ncbi:xyloglucan galactosyltransferase [Vigna angularis]|uniref:Xyloglucan galactosyltransferase n=1 Tax=Phaseolus angularis TaxID=3914 RepID=A0A8T0K3P2_PHAAN|nr:xyloglucan galactosyltransferase [Vigna angularis]
MGKRKPRHSDGNRWVGGKSFSLRLGGREEVVDRRTKPSLFSIGAYATSDPSYKKLCKIVDNGDCEHDPVRFMRPMLQASFYLKHDSSPDLKVKKDAFDLAIRKRLERCKKLETRVWDLEEGEEMAQLRVRGLGTLFSSGRRRHEVLWRREEEKNWRRWCIRVSMVHIRCRVLLNSRVRQHWLRHKDFIRTCLEVHWNYRGTLHVFGWGGLMRFWWLRAFSLE